MCAEFCINKSLINYFLVPQSVHLLSQLLNKASVLNWIYQKNQLKYNFLLFLFKQKHWLWEVLFKFVWLKYFQIYKIFANFYALLEKKWFIMVRSFL